MIEFSASKSVVLLISPHPNRVPNKPNIYLGHNILSYVHEFKYLGHVSSECFTDDKDIERERRALATRGNLLLHKFRFCSNDVKCLLFKTYCYQMYCCSLWSRYRNYSLNRIKVTYNNIMRRVMSLPPWCSASSMFVTLNVYSFQEVLRNSSFGLLNRLESSPNMIISNLRNSDANVRSSFKKECRSRLYVT